MWPTQWALSSLEVVCSRHDAAGVIACRPDKEEALISRAPSSRGGAYLRGRIYCEIRPNGTRGVLRGKAMVLAASKGRHHMTKSRCCGHWKSPSVYSAAARCTTGSVGLRTWCCVARSRQSDFSCFRQVTLLSQPYDARAILHIDYNSTSKMSTTARWRVPQRRMSSDCWESPSASP